MKKYLFTIIIPIHNGDSTIEETFDSILKQKNLKFVKEIILINDGSTDKSQEKIDSFKKGNNLNIKIIKHPKAKGLASSFNQAIKITKTDFIIFTHQDVILNSNLALIKLEKIINKNPNVFYIFPIVCHPRYVWNKYNFWQKCLFSRYINAKHYSPIEKFDCVNRQKLINIGLYDKTHFRTAGEDLDLMIRANRKNLQYVCSNIQAIHLHNKNPDFSFKDLVKKEKQYAETKGVLLRIYGFNIPNFRSFFREAIFIGLFIPKVNILAILLLIIYIIGYNWRMYPLIFQDKKVILLPFINLYLFFANIISSTKAFLNKKQII